MLICLIVATFSISCSSNLADPAEPTNEIRPRNPQVGQPGQVADLFVLDRTAVSATLAFTEVDDGAGGAANYAVRTQLGSLAWGTANEVQTGSCAAPVRGQEVGARITCTVLGLDEPTGYEFQVVAFRGEFQNGAIYGALSNVASDEQAPASPANPTGSNTNEPAGMSRIAESSFDCRPGGGCEPAGVWTEASDDWKQGNLSIVPDASGPRSPGSALRLRFPSEMQDGISPARFDAWGPGRSSEGAYDYRELYVTYWIKIEGTDYQNETVGTKTHYVAYGSTIRNNHSAPFLSGTFSGQSVMQAMTYSPYVYEMEDDGSDAGGGAQRRTPNVDASRKVNVGEWTQIELYYRINDIGPTQDNGVLRVWINGQLTHEEYGIRYRSDTNPKGFYHLQFTPVYGGNMGDVRTRDDYWRLDHLYISGKM